MPTFGSMRMIDILPEHVRAWITALKNQGMKPVSIRHNKIILSAIFTTAMDDQVTFIRPCRGVRTPPVVRKLLEIITPEQFDDVYHALPEGAFRLLAETEIESGLRWGELSELCVKDLNLRSRILTVSRTVVELNPKFHPEGRHFLVKDYPKDKEYRRFKLSTQITEKLEAHIRSGNLTQDDLLFQMPPQDKPLAHITEIPAPATLGRTEPNEKGRTYKHGTLSGYTAGRCRCDYCRGTFTLYRAARRANGKDNPRPAASARPTVTSPTTGSTTRSGTPPWPPRASTSDPPCATYATPAPPGSSTAAPTSRW